MDVISEFEDMIDMSKLKALSNLSLERPLTDAEYTKMMMLKNKFFPMSDNEFKNKMTNNQF